MINKLYTPVSSQVVYVKREGEVLFNTELEKREDDSVRQYLLRLRLRQGEKKIQSSKYRYFALLGSFSQSEVRRNYSDGKKLPIEFL